MYPIKLCVPRTVMENQLGFLLKLLLFSTLLSVLIKYAAPFLGIPATVTNVITNYNYGHCSPVANTKTKAKLIKKI